jgi:hypothetical protein
VLNLLAGQLRRPVLASRCQDAAADEPVDGADVDGEDAGSFGAGDAVERHATKAVLDCLVL